MWETIRKFGLEHHDLQTMMWNIAVMWRILGMNIDERNKEKIPFYSYAVTIVAIVAHFYVYILSVSLFVINNIATSEGFLCSVISFALGICSCIGLAKLYCMFYLEETIRKIVTGYLASDALVDKRSRFFKNLKTTLRTIKRRTLIYWSVIIGNGIFYIAMPLLQPGRHHMEDCFEFYGFEGLMYISPYYEIAFIINIFGVYATCYFPANITAFFIIVTGYTEGQILALSEEMLSIWDNAKEHCDLLEENETVTESIQQRKSINEYVKKRLEYIVVVHKTNIGLITKVQTALSLATLFEFFILVVALIAILTGGLENTYVQLPFSLIMVGMDCLMGQRLLDAGTEFENAVYACKWENFDVANRKMVLLILQNAQKKMRLSAGGMRNLNYECIMRLFNGIYSAYTALRKKGIK